VERRRSKTRCGGRKALRSILALHPETALLTFCTGTLGYFHGVLIDAAKLCWQHRCQNMEAGRWPRRRCDSHSRVAVVSAGGGHGLVRYVKSITEQIQHT
jgi:hypothetical protein